MIRDKNALVSAKSRKKDLKGGSIAFRCITYVHLIIYALCILVPFFVVLKTSFTSNEELTASMKFIWFPQKGLTAAAYQTAFFSDLLKTYGISVLRSFFNTLWQTLPTVCIGLFVSGLSAFSFAKMNFPGKNVLFAILLSTMMIPTAVLTMPSYIFYDSIGWSSTVLPLIIPGMFGGAMIVFFLRQFFQGIPTDLVEAGKIDGMSYFMMYVKIIIPLAKPAFLAQFIFMFVGGYNSYVGPLLYLNGKIPLYSLQMALTLFRSIYSSKQAIVCAFAVLALLPLLIIYTFTQKYFTEGIANTGIKG